MPPRQPRRKDDTRSGTFRPSRSRTGQTPSCRQCLGRCRRTSLYQRNPRRVAQHPAGPYRLSPSGQRGRWVRANTCTQCGKAFSTVVRMLPLRVLRPGAKSAPFQQVRQIEDGTRTTQHGSGGYLRSLHSLRNLTFCVGSDELNQLVQSMPQPASRCSAAAHPACRGQVILGKTELVVESLIQQVVGLYCHPACLIINVHGFPFGFAARLICSGAVRKPRRCCCHGL